MTINYRDQMILFTLVTMVGIWVLITGVQTPPSRFDPLGSHMVILFIGCLVTLFSIICTMRAFRQWRVGGSPEDSENSRLGLSLGLAIIFCPTVISIAIVESVFASELVLAVIFILTGLLVIKISPGDRFSNRSIAYLTVSGLVLITGVTQLFKHVLGLPLP